jgi:hypothetical protein
VSRRKGQKSGNRRSSSSTHPSERPAAGAESNPAPAPADDRHYRRRFFLAAVVVAAWWAVLIALVIFTANPVTLNRRQLRSSSQIVTAEIVDAADGRVKVVKDWSGSGVTGELHVDGLRESGVRDEETYILPLSLTARGGWQVTPAPEAPDRRLVYPATDDALQQLAEFVGGAKHSGR